MPTFHLRLLVLLILFFRGIPTLAQTSQNLDAARLRHQLETGRYVAYLGAMDSVVARTQDLTHRIVNRPDGDRENIEGLLWTAQELFDSLLFLADTVAEAKRDAETAAETLARALGPQVENLQKTLAVAEPRERNHLEPHLLELEKELGEVREGLASLRGSRPQRPLLLEAESLARIVATEHARESRLQILDRRLRQFLRGIQLFDETGVPPSDPSSEQGSEPGIICPVACPVAPPGDVPLSMTPMTAGGSPGEASVGGEVTEESLRRLHSRIVEWGDVAPAAAVELSPQPQDGLEASAGLSFADFRDSGENRSGFGAGVWASWPFLWERAERMRLFIEPVFGVRLFEFAYSSVIEVAAESTEWVVGELGERGVRWQIRGHQKARGLSKAPYPPVYLEPSRVEGSLEGGLLIPLQGMVRLDVAASGSAVRYGPWDWEILNREGAGGTLGLSRTNGSGFTRVLMEASTYGFAQMDSVGTGRRDDRVGVTADWRSAGKGIVQISFGAFWSDSSMPAYDFTSRRISALLAIPMGRGSLQLFAALARKHYRNPGSSDARVAPSDQDTGSAVTLQWALPITGNRSIRLQAGWSRGETGFRNQFLQRIGLGVQYSFPPLGSSL